MEDRKIRVSALVVSWLWLFCSSMLVLTVDSQVPIPPRYDGFLYKHKYLSLDSIIVEAFFDPICPDSRDAWPPLKKALHDYSHHVSLIVHPFALPYHDNSFVSCRALHIADTLNSSTTYPLLETFFKHQEKFYNNPTFHKSRESIVKEIVKLAAKVVGNFSALESGFENSSSRTKAIISFKYGCSRGVTGTPFFFVNGMPLSESGSALNYSDWRRTIDPLLGAHSGRKLLTPVSPLDSISTENPVHAYV
ncbi:hypothetical protein AMTRI_Chr09g34530 [Amborella trichopoda]|uniref:Thioredoxin-like fold domain-containing protein n=1 Tax=Amborella trichopoda TaxID=13333 RepID=W1NL19_AMBTC|nr:uncharacterized protein LOC18424125 [Amborella trichopoda]ERM96198.1 hypothetical protein AMTR_s00001p00108660 [Amborella trichopoda]|eukprot:XP_006828782.1 uncharacterized protein LOC18424125 [Amborella trichopoda]